MPKARLVFDGDNIYTEKDARIYKLKNDISSKIDWIPWVVNSLDSISTTDALSANMGRQLQDQINSLSWTWKFLSTWDCTTWLPGTNPQEDPYTYKVWDYYVVSAVGSTNYKPHWGTYTQWVASTTVELENVWINDKYYFDGADWVRIPDTSIQISIDTTLDTTSTNAVENRAIATAINWKQNIISDLATIRSWAAAWATALQPNANISQLTNNVGYQTAWDVNAAIQSAIWQLPTVNDWVLTIQKNSTTIDTFSANSASNKTIDISVPTTVAELSDSSDYATKTYVDNAIDWLIHEWSAAPQNPQEWDLWYDTVNHVLKIYNWTSWETVDTDTDTTYTAWNWINISAQNEISVDTTTIATQSDLNWKQDVLTAWANIQISNNVISATSTTYTAWEWIEIKNWDDYSAMRWPCPSWFHIATGTEWTELMNVLFTTFWLTESWWALSSYLKMPAAWHIVWDTGVSSNQWVEREYQTCIWETSNPSISDVFIATDNDTLIGFNYRTNANTIRPFKDEPVIPDSSWTTLYDWSSISTWAGIFHSTSLWLISISWDGTNWITIANKNLWATIVYNSWDILSEANCGKYYQWGNNYWFSYNWTFTTSSTQVDASTYWPWNYYNSSTFIIYAWNWSSVQNDNLWWWVTWVVTVNNAVTNTGVLSVNGQTGDIINVVTWDAQYEIVVSNSAPASWTPNNIITLVL